MTVANLVEVTTFLSSREYAVQNREVRQAVLGDDSPAFTAIITGIFDETVATRNRSSGSGLTPPPAAAEIQSGYPDQPRLRRLRMRGSGALSSCHPHTSLADSSVMARRKKISTPMVTSASQKLRYSIETLAAPGLHEGEQSENKYNAVTDQCHDNTGLRGKAALLSRRQARFRA
ncbi:MAG: hypothetical protein H0U43_01540 [Chthoniobacterales bacterium]|nr:hypothetical protein [Chthoniobacterales bacterium]